MLFNDIYNFIAASKYVLSILSGLPREKTQTNHALLFIAPSYTYCLDFASVLLAA